MAPNLLKNARTSAEEALFACADAHQLLDYLLNQVLPDLLITIEKLGGSTRPEQRSHRRSLTNPDVKTVDQGRDPHNIVLDVQ